MVVTLIDGEWRTGEEDVGIYLVAEDNTGKRVLILHTLYEGKAWDLRAMRYKMNLRRIS